MNRDDIIKMAEDAGFIWETDHPAIVALAKLAYAAGAAAERKRIISANAPEIERINEYIKTLEEAVAAEREACAKVCDEYEKVACKFESQRRTQHYQRGKGASACAWQIRQRGTQ